jgi:hypothetical protein
VSTRSVIARPTPEGGFGGTYCHNDGYPAHQGRILFALTHPTRSETRPAASGTVGPGAPGSLVGRQLLPADREDSRADSSSTR